MRKYELMYIIRPDMDQEAMQIAVDKFQAVISNDGEITKHDIMGKRRLAYEIKKYRDGIYVLVNFTAEPAVINELERQLKISDDVIRHLIVSKVA